VLARLLQVGTFTGTIERDFALFSAALGADSPVNSGAEPLFFSNFANGATHEEDLVLFHYGIRNPFCGITGFRPCSLQEPRRRRFPRTTVTGGGVILAFLNLAFKKTA
jgi:hypothetical protein